MGFHLLNKLFSGKKKQITNGVNERESKSDRLVLRAEMGRIILIFLSLKSDISNQQPIKNVLYHYLLSIGFTEYPYAPAYHK